MKKICVMGPGDIGLPTASILATKAYEGIVERRNRDRYARHLEVEP